MGIWMVACHAPGRSDSPSRTSEVSGLPYSHVVGPMVGANLLEKTSVLALPLGLCGGALPFRTGDLSFMHAAGLGKRSLSFFLSRLAQHDFLIPALASNRIPPLPPSTLFF
eukprot:1160804-Pelagomonas_calceolata.AAC.3